MAAATVSDDEFIALWQKYQSATALQKILEISVRSIHYRRRRIEERTGIELKAVDLYSPNPKIESYQAKLEIQRIQHQKKLEETRHSVRRGITLEKGRVIVFSDAHFYPDDETTAYRALLKCIKEFKPEVIICNGDAFDGTSISRHARIGWANAPSVLEELEAVKYFLGEIESASTFKSNLIWTLGNHDARFETFLSAQVPQYQDIQGFQLKDHFPTWQPCWSYWINNDTVIKHRWKGGRYAGSNNTTHAGVNIVTGHTHQLKVEPFTDYNGTRYGVQTGCLAYPKGDQFIDYTEDNSVDWRSGFALLTFDRGQLLMPELIQVWDEEAGEVQFRGKIYQV